MISWTLLLLGFLFSQGLRCVGLHHFVQSAHVTNVSKLFFVAYTYPNFGYGTLCLLSERIEVFVLVFDVYFSLSQKYHIYDKKKVFFEFEHSKY